MPAAACSLTRHQGRAGLCPARHFMLLSHSLQVVRRTVPLPHQVMGEICANILPPVGAGIGVC